MKECLKKIGLDVRQARRMLQDRSEFRGFVRGECKGRSPGDEPLTLTRCHSWVEICLLPSLQLKGHKGEHFFLSFLSFVSLLL